MGKKKGIDITGALSAFDNEYVTEPKAELGVKKGDKKLDVSAVSYTHLTLPTKRIV